MRLNNGGMQFLHVSILTPEFLSTCGTETDDSDKNKAEQSDLSVTASCWILGGEKCNELLCGLV
ncbi:hypothetical protein OIDMADRAFT_20954 [Oidiodendron maius Zn]|uniref:Uncharacterized protein n=1 Tax=Oidiodendron maius (strain Zn) TaxID=913774 RepID=A0A0C3H0P7_OIDMZ|nr:hypothetical protein OIDMADRAFT_20954 [Oidiodendron maius Zn]